MGSIVRTLIKAQGFLIRFPYYCVGGGEGKSMRVEGFGVSGSRVRGFKSFRVVGLCSVELWVEGERLVV